MYFKYPLALSGIHPRRRPYDIMTFDFAGKMEYEYKCIYIYSYIYIYIFVHMYRRWHKLTFSLYFKWMLGALSFKCISAWDRFCNVSFKLWNSGCTALIVVVVHHVLRRLDLPSLDAQVDKCFQTWGMACAVLSHCHLLPCTVLEWHDTLRLYMSGSTVKWMRQRRSVYQFNLSDQEQPCLPVTTWGGLWAHVLKHHLQLNTG